MRPSRCNGAAICCSRSAERCSLSPLLSPRPSAPPSSAPRKALRTWSSVRASFPRRILPAPSGSLSKNGTLFSPTNWRSSCALLTNSSLPSSLLEFAQSWFRKALRAGKSSPLRRNERNPHRKRKIGRLTERGARRSTHSSPALSGLPVPINWLFRGGPLLLALPRIRNHFPEPHHENSVVHDDDSETNRKRAQ